MKDDDALPISTPTSSSVLSSSSSSGIFRKDTSGVSSAIFGRGRYKFWALAAILLLAFWSMLTGTVTLRWSAGNLNRLGDEYSSPSAEDLDVLDLEEREKMVKHMWDVYTNSQQRIRLASFWQEAFVAAYEDLTSEMPEVREAAFSEIARMSARYIPLQTPPLHSYSSSARRFQKASAIHAFLPGDERGGGTPGGKSGVNLVHAAAPVLHHSSGTKFPSTHTFPKQSTGRRQH